MRAIFRALVFVNVCLMSSMLFAQEDLSQEALAPKATETVVTRCKLDCSQENESYAISLIQSFSLRSQVAQLYAKQFPSQKENTRHTDWTTRLAMPGVVTFDAESKIVTFTVAAETFIEAQQINHTYVALCRKTFEDNNKTYLDRTAKLITTSIRAKIDAENKRLQQLLDAPSSTRVKWQREECVQRLKTLNAQLQYAEDSVNKQIIKLEVLP
jgi:hypothetical protein